MKILSHARQKGLSVSNFTHLWVVFKWRHGSEGVKIFIDLFIYVSVHLTLLRCWVSTASRLSMFLLIPACTCVCVTDATSVGCAASRQGRWRRIWIGTQVVNATCVSCAARRSVRAASCGFTCVATTRTWPSPASTAPSVSTPRVSPWVNTFQCGLSQQTWLYLLSTLLCSPNWGACIA